MNSEAASETQYEDSKSQLSTYRKDDKIMLKRKLLSVLLALVLVVCMAVPALAASWGGINYNLTASRGATTSSVTMTVTNATVQVKAAGHAYVYALALNQRLWGNWGTTTSSVSSTSATHYINNYVYDSDGNLYTGTIEAVEGRGHIGSNIVDYVYA